jgi:hypothetical protein
VAIRYRIRPVKGEDGVVIEVAQTAAGGEITAWVTGPGGVFETFNKAENFLVRFIAREVENRKPARFYDDNGARV